MRVSEIQTERALAQSGINLSDYVINPYRGCAFGCSYCYVKKNKISERTKEPWGEFVDVKVNLPELLEKELLEIKPERVLIGSITDPYQPLELKYELTRKTLELLEKNGVAVTILTRSAHIVRDLELLQSIPGARIYFTINWPDEKQMRVFEKASPPFNQRLASIKKLADAGLEVIPNVSPLFPGFFDVSFYFKNLSGLVNRVSLESFNLKVMTGDEINTLFTRHFPEQYALFKEVYSNKKIFEFYWNTVKNQVQGLNEKYNIEVEFLFHSYDSYFGRD